MLRAALLAGLGLSLFASSAKATIYVYMNFRPTGGGTLMIGPVAYSSGQAISIDARRLIGGVDHQMRSATITSDNANDEVGVISMTQSSSTGFDGSNPFCVVSVTQQTMPGVTAPVCPKAVRGMNYTATVPTKFELLAAGTTCNIVGPIDTHNIGLIYSINGTISGAGRLIQRNPGIEPGFPTMRIDYGTIANVTNPGTGAVEDVIRSYATSRIEMIIRNEWRGRVNVTGGITSIQGRNTSKIAGELVSTGRVDLIETIHNATENAQIGDGTSTLRISAGAINRLVTQNAVLATLVANGPVIDTDETLQRFVCPAFTGSLSVLRTQKDASQTWTNAVEITGPINGDLNFGNIQTPVVLSGGWDTSAPHTLKATSVQSTLQNVGNLPANVTSQFSAFTGTGAFVVTGTASGLIVVDGGMAGTMRFGVTASAKGLDGQVTVNALANATTPGLSTWTGPVFRYGSTSTSERILPTSNIYPDLSTFFSDQPSDYGSVGRAPYQLHVQDSLPANSPTWTIASPPPAASVPMTNRPSWVRKEAGSQIRARFYGPLLLSSISGQTGKFVTIERQDPSTLAWSDVTASFDVGIDQTVPNIALSRDLLFTVACNVTAIDGLYRARRSSDVSGNPYTSKLLSRYTGATTPAADEAEVAPFVFYFRLGCTSCNKADVGRAGGLGGADCILDNNDEVAFIDYFFANNPIADLGIAGGFPGSDGLFDNNDFVAFWNYYFLGCGQAIPCPQGFAGPGMEQLSLPASMPEWMQTENADANQRLRALWLMYESTGDARVMLLIQEELFAAGVGG